MTTAFYYTLLQRIFEAAGFDTVLCEKGSLNGYVVNKREDIFVTGDSYQSFKLWLKGYTHICTWYQGVVPEERRMQGSNSLIVLLHAIVEKFSLKISLFSFFVSKAIKEHYERKYNLSFTEDRYEIIPCFNEKGPFKNCFLPGVKRPFSFVYSGGMGVWQCFNETLEVFKIIKSHIPEATLAVYTYQVDKAEDVVKHNGIEGVDVQFIPKEQMNDALSDKMFGFVLRADNTVNNVATPTKLSNLTANGVIPICSLAVKDFSDVTRKNKYVIHVKSDNVLLMAEDIINEAKKIVANYSTNVFFDEIKDLYSEYYSEDYYVKSASLKVAKLFKKDVEK